jgi:glyoxylase-like metal-dependent hydrolase (beta-lactamase superfamily II)
MHLDRMRFRSVTSEWLAQHSITPNGVFLTHLHLDHITGMRDVPANTPVYVGPGEAGHRALLNWFTMSLTDQALANKPPLAEWNFTADPDRAFEGIIDIFGDRTVFAIKVPGHTSGSVAYLARTQRGPLLLTGDASHTTWGWTHGVEPGSYSEDRPRSAASLTRLKQLADRHPTMEVRPGHQLFASAVATTSR